MSTTEERTVKILVLGDTATGKTSIIKRYVYSNFSEQHIATATVDFILKIVKKENVSYRIQLWDIAGQDRYQNISRVYYRSALAAFIVCDNTRRDTLSSINKWKSQLDEKVTLPNGKPLPVMMLVNKSDLVDKTDMTEEEIQSCCQSCGISDWKKTSAKTGEHIEEVMNALLEKVINSEGLWEEAEPEDGISPSEGEKKKKKSCC